MTGRYKIFIGASQGYFDLYKPASGWSGFVAICRSLHHDGLNYQIRIVIDDKPYILMTAKGTPKQRRQTRKLLLAKPKYEPLKHEKCERELTEAEKRLTRMRDRMRGRSCGWASVFWSFPNWRYQHNHDSFLPARRRMLGKWLARRLAGTVVHTGIRPQDYTALDELLQFRVRRFSEMGKQYRDRIDGIRDYVLRELLQVFGSGTGKERHNNRVADPKPFPFAEFQDAVADMEYWRELELISGQREHFKPGLSEVAVYQDDEVAA